MIIQRNNPSPHYRKRLTASAFLLLLLASPLQSSATDEQSASEYAVKAAIIFKITKFVSWPDDAFSGPDEPLSVCLPIADPMGTALDALTGMTVQGRAIEVRRFNDITSELSNCKVLYLSKASNGRRSSVVSDVANLPVLTIGDTDDFVELGGIVTLKIQQSRVAFAINVGASDQAGLDISAQLLQLATIKTSRNNR